MLILCCYYYVFDVCVCTVCCIFHKRHVFGEDSDSSSSSDSDSDSASDSGDEGDHKGDAQQNGNHACADGCKRAHHQHKHRLNAYERQPKYVRDLQQQKSQNP